MQYHKHLVTAREVQQQLQNEHWRIIDCRFDLMAPQKGREDYLAGHIPGAAYADLDRDLAAAITESTGRHPLPDVDDFARQLGAWGIDNDSQVVAYDGSNGAIAARLWWMLRWLGHTRVAVLDGGMEAWARLGGDLESGSSDTLGKIFEPHEKSHLVIDAETVLASIGSDLKLFDARDEQRFLGKTEPIDSVAGHIPGARNFPFSGTVSSDGRWLHPDDLRTAWSAALAGQPGSNTAVMCGSGVTACHLALSADLAGLPLPRLYVGSWSEWIRDPTRPIASSSGAESADSS